MRRAFRVRGRCKAFRVSRVSRAPKACRASRRTRAARVSRTTRASRESRPTKTLRTFRLATRTSRLETRTSRLATRTSMPARATKTQGWSPASNFMRRVPAIGPRFREEAASRRKTAGIDPLRRGVWENSRSPRARRAGFLTTEWAGRLFPGVDAALDMARGSETRVLCRLNRHRRTFAKGAVEQQALVRPFRKLVQHAAFADVFLQGRIGDMQ